MGLSTRNGLDHALTVSLVPGGGKGELTTHADPHVKVPVQTRSELDKLWIVCGELRGIPAAYQRFPVSWDRPAGDDLGCTTPPMDRASGLPDAATVRRPEQGRQLELRTGPQSLLSLMVTPSRTGHPTAYCAQTGR